MKHSDTGLSSETFGMPLDGLEAANRQVSDQALKLAREVISQTGGTFTNPNWFWSPLYAQNPQDIKSKIRSEVDDISLHLWGEPTLISGLSSGGDKFHMGLLGSFDGDTFQPSRFRLEEGSIDSIMSSRWNAVINGFFEVALNEVEIPYVTRGHYGFSEEVRPITVAWIETIYTNRGVFQAEERVGKAYSGEEEVMQACNDRRAAFLVADYFRAKAQEDKEPAKTE